MAQRRGLLEGGALLGWIALSLGVMTAAVLSTAGTSEGGVRTLIRATARSSLGLFLLAFVASSLRQLWRHPFSAWALRNRRQLGLGFVISHAIHLAAIVALATQWPSAFATTSAVTRYGGGLGFVVAGLLAATSSDAAVRRLGARRWRALHRAGVLYLFGIFASNYGPAVFFDLNYAPASAAVWAALGLRFVAWRATRARGRSSPREPLRSASR